MSELPFRVEYARSGKSTCKNCHTRISVDTLRIARLFKSALFDGYQTNWFHDVCFFVVHRPQSVGDIGGFESIRTVDQEFIAREIENGTKLYEFVAKKSKRVKNIKLEAQMSVYSLRDFGVEYAKSGRAVCRKCNEAIAKKYLRVKKTIYDSDVGMRFGGEPLWYHLECFAADRHMLGWLGGGRQLPGLADLHQSDQLFVCKLITPMVIKSDERIEAKQETKPITAARLAAIRAQTERYFGNRDYCHRHLTKREMVTILRSNRQDAPKTLHGILDALADTLTFGALERCPQCNSQLYLNNSSFQCNGYLSEWVQCEYTSATPKRKPASVPLKIRRKHKYLRREYAPKDRLFHNVKPIMSIQAAVKPVKEEVVKNEEAE